ncbi:MarR family winged helix-turn-helix transcriptional regulator [Massilia endophytica]|uniref:MarR family winged helix-turn-helix transcriptional regulator n=1 Tax=Massilia endophytica TaxID=2899220 RepID=UPI001E2B12AE|nr:MarR family transcriptional regulator [Massilia endophytica]UGQ45558.1 MarR family transcriptional regulator [Massilia endophytica]
MKPGLGTQLRHLIELLDGAVGEAYDAAGLDYRPRYTPVMRALAEGRPLTLGQIAERARITQPAATQTVNLMLKADLVVSTPGTLDARQKLVSLSPHGKAMLPKLQRCWAATKGAADSLDADMSHPLSEALAEAIAALEQQPFGERIRAAMTANKKR